MFNRIIRRIAVALTFAAAGASHGFPDKPITLIAPFAAGSATDVAARTFADVLSKALNQGVVTDNRTGAEGSIGARAVITGPTDGHTMLFTSSSLTVLDPLMKANMPYDPSTDLIPVCSVASVRFLANVTGASPYKSVADLVAAAKAAPGKLTFAYSSASTRLAGELFQQAAGIKLTGIPYRSSVLGLTEVAAGQVDLFFIDPVSAASFHQSGKIRPLVVAGPARMKELPDVPSAVEAGIAEFNVAPWYGVYITAKAPAAVVEQVRNAVAQAMRRPEMKAALEQRNLISGSVCGEAMRTFQRDEVNLWRRVTTKAGIAPQ